MINILNKISKEILRKIKNGFKQANNMIDDNHLKFPCDKNINNFKFSTSTKSIKFL